jgi:SAM-dependent methyltransferase
MSSSLRHSQFYSDYFSRNKVVGQWTPTAKEKIIIDYLCRIKTEWGTVLDIGCMNSPFMYEFRKRAVIRDYYGMDLLPEEEGQALLKEGHYRRVNIDDGIPDCGVKFEVIVCSEVIEHLFSPDNVFRFAQENLAPGGLLVITTPNLGVWYNRFLLFAGYQPTGTEVSDQYNDLGKIWTDSQHVGGHLRLFTLRALLAMGDRYNFRAKKVEAVTDPANWLMRVTLWLGKIRPSLGKNLLCFFELKS